MSSSADVSEGLKSCLSVEIPQVHLSSRPALIPAKVRCHNLQLENVKVTRVTHKRCMIICDCMGIPQNSLTTIGPYLGKLFWGPPLGGPVGLPPPFFIWRETQKSKSEKREEKGTDGGLTTSPFPSCPNFIAPSCPPTYRTIPIPVRSNHQLWTSLYGAHPVACGDVAIIGDSVTLPAILFWKTLQDRSLCPPFLSPLAGKAIAAPPAATASHRRRQPPLQQRRQSRTSIARLYPLIFRRGGGGGADNNNDSHRRPPWRDCLRLQWRPKMIQCSCRDDDNTIDGSKSSQQSTNDTKWGGGGLRWDDTPMDKDTQTTITQNIRREG